MKEHQYLYIKNKVKQTIMAKQISKNYKFVLTLAVALFSSTNAVGGGQCICL